MIQLCSVPKLQGSLLPRAVDPQTTYHRLQPLMPKVGVMYVLEITALDTLGIPICFALGPLKPGIDLRVYARQVLQIDETKVDQLMATIEVFSQDEPLPELAPVFAAGKGITTLDSRVSAMMEAVERFSARQPTTRPRVCSFREIASQMKGKVVDPRSLILVSPGTFDENQLLEWVAGSDLCSGEEVWLPAEATTYTYKPLQVDSVCSDTPTGLGAGNTLEEAVSHGLAEAIEHDAWTLAITRSLITSAQKGIQESLFGMEPQDSLDFEQLTGEVDKSFVPLDMDSLEHVWPVADLINQFKRAGTQVNIFDVTSDIGIPVFATSVTGLPGGPDGGGLGAYPDARLAVVRAITEAAQQRLLLGLRNPLVQKRAVPEWGPLPWEYSSANSERGLVRRFEEVGSVTNIDILEDIRCMLESLRLRGLNQVIVVDLTKPVLDVPVVKVVVPGLADYWTSAVSPQWTALGSRVLRYINTPE